MAILETLGVVSAANHAAQLGSKLTEIRDIKKFGEISIEFNETIIELQGKASDAQMTIFEMHDKVLELKRENRELKNLIADKDQYKLAEFTSGSWCYISNDFVGCYKDTRKLCCNCYDNGTKSTLTQSHGVHLGTTPKWSCACNTCKELWYFKEFNYTPAPDHL